MTNFEIGGSHEKEKDIDIYINKIIQNASFPDKQTEANVRELLEKTKKISKGENNNDVHSIMK